VTPGTAHEARRRQTEAQTEKSAGGPMADFIQLQCSECQRINYSTFRNKKTKQEKLLKKKYCPWDRKHTDHKEVKG
jgi:large subunit ribosomal protein L33